MKALNYIILTTGVCSDILAKLCQVFRHLLRQSCCFDVLTAMFAQKFFKINNRIIGLIILFKTVKRGSGDINIHDTKEAGNLLACSAVKLNSMKIIPMFSHLLSQTCFLFL